MPSCTESTPTLWFFDHAPAKWLEHPPLASGLQTLDSTLMLLGLKRFPAALVSCVSAIESVARAANGWGPRRRETAMDAIKPIKLRRGDSRMIERISLPQIQALVHQRNEIAHYGASPRDDAKCASLLLETGFPLLDACLTDCFGFSLCGSCIDPRSTSKLAGRGVAASQSGLDTDLAVQLRFTQEIFRRSKGSGSPDARLCLLGLMHRLENRLRPCVLTQMELDLVNDGDTRFQFRNRSRSAKEKLADRQRRAAINLPDFDWNFECPLCGMKEVLHTEIFLDNWESGEISAGSANCSECDFRIPTGVAHVADVLLDDQLRDSMPEVAKQYGLKRRKATGTAPAKIQLPNT